MRLFRGRNGRVPTSVSPNEKRCRFRAATSNPQRILKGTARHLVLPAFAGIPQRNALRSSLRSLAAALPTAFFCILFGRPKRKNPAAGWHLPESKATKSKLLYGKAHPTANLLGGGVKTSPYGVRQTRLPPGSGMCCKVSRRRARTPALPCETNGHPARRRVAPQGPAGGVKTPPYGVRQTRLPPGSGIRRKPSRAAGENARPATRDKRASGAAGGVARPDRRGQDPALRGHA